MTTEIAQKKIAALNAAGDALIALGLGSVRLRYREIDHMIQRPCFTLWVEGASGKEYVGVGDTPGEALNDAVEQLTGRKAA